MALADVVSDSGHPVPGMRLTKRMVLNRSIALYGPSDSGKSIYTKHILDLLRGEVDQLIIVAPTEPVNRTFANYAEGPLIHYGLTAPHPKKPGERLDGPKGAELFIKNILSRQEMLMGIWKKANQPAVLESLFARVSSRLQQEAAPVLEKLARANQTHAALLRRRFRADPSELKKKLKELEARIASNVGAVHKHFIEVDLARVWSQSARLSEEETWALTYLKMRPGIVLVFDDCAASIKSLFKKEEFRTLFYQGRHYQITVIFTFQDDTDLDTNLRKNAFISIFCGDVVCRSFFTQPSNRFSKDTKKLIEDIAPAVFKGVRKLAYMRGDPKGRLFYHVTVPAPEEKMFCSPAVQELCSGVKASSGRLNEDNPFYASFLPSA